jgi:predicted Zn-dependent protease
MRKIILQGLVSLSLFFSTWILLAQVNWISILRVQTVGTKTEEKLGDLFWDVFHKSEKEEKDPAVVQPIDSIITKICEANHFDRKFIKLHVLYKDEVNAFALPNGHLIVFTGLIQAAENPEEVAGVLGHEIAHIQHKHVMKKLIREVGLSTLLSMTSGGGGEVVKGAAKSLSSSAFDRTLEKEADISSVDYLKNADIDPKPFADFLFRISTEQNMPDYFSWISTHPDSEERSKYLIEYIGKGKAKYEPVLSEGTWEEMQASIDED